MGHPPGLDAWRIAITHPETGATTLANSDEHQKAVHSDAAHAAAIVSLKDEAMSVSAIWGKFFLAEGETYGHIIDPRDGRPASRTVLAAVILPSATETDALSTALLTVGLEGHQAIAGLREGMRTLVIGKAGGQLCSKSKGIEVLAAAGESH